MSEYEHSGVGGSLGGGEGRTGPGLSGAMEQGQGLGSGGIEGKYTHTFNNLSIISGC